MAGSFNTRLGTSPEEGIKAPVVTAANTNITLSGEQTITGVDVVDGDRVLVNAQDDATQNGIYVANVAAWVRATDFNAAEDVVNGVLVLDASNSNLYQASFSGAWDPDSTEVTFANVVALLPGGNEFVPLSGTKNGFPVSGPIMFSGSAGNLYSFSPDVYGSQVMGFIAQQPDSGFVIDTQTDEGERNIFAFTSRGSFLIPSNSAPNTESWEFNSIDFGGDSNTLVIAPVDANGDQTSHQAVVSPAPGVSFTFHTDGYIESDRATISGDPDLALVTKGYADALNPASGEANTSSNVGAGAGLAKAKSTVDLPFKSIIGGTNVTIVEGTDDITINADATGGGGDLPTGSVGQILVNDDGSVSYSASGAILVGASGMAVGTSPSTPLVAMQVHGDLAVVDGGKVTVGNAAGTFVGQHYITGSNRWQFDAPAASGITIDGDIGAGSGITLSNKGEEAVGVYGGSGAAFARLSYNATAKLDTVADGISVTGTVVCNDPSEDNEAVTKGYGEANYVMLTSASEQVIDSDVEIQGDLQVGPISSLGGVTVAGKITGPTDPTADNEVGDRAYNDVRYYRKTDTTLVKTSGNQNISGIKTFINDTWFGNACAVRSLGNSGSTDYHFLFYSDVAQTNLVGSIATSHGASQTYYNTTSDYRMKVAPRTLDEDWAVSMLRDCPAMTWRWKGGSEEGYGFIAHELAEVFPQAVTGEKDGEMMQTVDYSKLVPLLWAQNQSLLRRIDDMEERLNAAGI